MKLQLLCAALLAVPIVSMAGVNPRNGNFYLTYEDLVVNNGSHKLTLRRTYNSLSEGEGWFGYGWGSMFETRLVVLPDGSAVVLESGTGRTTYYHTNSDSDIKAGAQKIVDVIKARDNLSSSSAEKLYSTLLSNEDLRWKKVIKYGIKTELAPGAGLGDVCGDKSLTRTDEGYRRFDCNKFGDTELAIDIFDLQGRLVRHTLTDGYAVTQHYPDASHTEISDTLGQRISLVRTPEGQISSASAEGKQVNYTYDENKNLLKSSFTSGDDYRYSYDRYHNLTRISYRDTSNMFISYSPKAIGMADSVTDRNGDRETFVYKTDPRKESHYWTEKTTISNTGEINHFKIDFEDQKSTTGITNLGMRTISKGVDKRVTLFDSQGSVTNSFDTKSPVYKYDDQKNLSHITNVNGKEYDLVYSSPDQVGRVTETNNEDSTKRVLTFEYDANNHLSKLNLLGIGSFNVRYDSDGQIIPPNSDDESEPVVQVLHMFIDICQLTENAGLDLFK